MRGGKARPVLPRCPSPKYGEAPISVSGIGDGTVDLTIRRVGKVTNEIFERYEGGQHIHAGPLWQRVRL